MSRLCNVRFLSVRSDFRTLFRCLLPAACCLLSVALLPSIVSAQGRPSLDELHKKMVQDEIIGGGIKNERVIQAMRDTPRHEFVALANRANAYFDMSLPIGEQQTISGPFVVAYMTAFKVEAS